MVSDEYMSQAGKIVLRVVSVAGLLSALHIFTRFKTLDLLFIRSWPLPFALLFVVLTLVVLRLRYAGSGHQARNLLLFFSLFGMAPILSYLVLGELGSVYFAMGLVGISGLLSDHQSDNRKP